MENINKSIIGDKMSSLTGVRAIMDDIKRVRARGDVIHADLSAGNPVVLPELVKLWQKLGKEVLESDAVGDILVRYGQSRGYEPLINAIVKKFNALYGLSLTADNVLITPGTQSAYFYLAAALSGKSKSGQDLEITLPYCPDYTGYEGVVLDRAVLKAVKPSIELVGERNFRYKADLDKVAKANKGGYILFSRPSNPTGGVVSEDEVKALSEIALKLDKYLVIDNAYGAPFPNLTEVEVKPLFGEHIINCFSLSKTGLPGERVGIIIGNKDIIRLLESFQANCILHPSRFGEAVAAKAIESGELEKICSEVVAPYYAQKRKVLVNTVNALFPKNVAWRFHVPEGALFGWLWIEGLKSTDWELYYELTTRGLLVVPGSSFFVGLQEEWKHSKECFRISLTASEAELVKGIEIFAAKLKEL